MSEQILDWIKSRRSVHDFLPDPIPDSIIAQLLDTAVFAPSAGNEQPWFFYVVRNAYLKHQLSTCALGQKFIENAPLVIVVCADLQLARQKYKKRGETLYCIQSTAAATQNLLLAVHALQLGACWVGTFDEASVARVLSMPPTQRPLVLVPIGKPASYPTTPPRRTLDQVFMEVD